MSCTSANASASSVFNPSAPATVRALEELFQYYLRTPGSMPGPHEELARSEPRHVAVCDYIAGMTDQFLLRQHHEHFRDSAAAG